MRWIRLAAKRAFSRSCALLSTLLKPWRATISAATEAAAISRPSTSATISSISVRPA